MHEQQCSMELEHSLPGLPSRWMCGCRLCLVDWSKKILPTFSITTWIWILLAEMDTYENWITHTLHPSNVSALVFHHKITVVQQIWINLRIFKISSLCESSSNNKSSWFKGKRKINFSVTFAIPEATGGKITLHMQKDIRHQHPQYFLVSIAAEKMWLHLE